ncbi:alpha/beta-hydrolase [Pyrenochaeta sp. DS3sAY3a]|nr:alpha/beta-hydrolase [Pyrenochaeta sp. DS3sAY3a]
MPRIPLSNAVPTPSALVSRRLAHSLSSLDAPRRRAYSAVTAPPRREHITVPCRSNGPISIDIFHAAVPSSPIVLYLPPGPVVPECSEEQDLVISTLLESSNATIARINYRASSVHSYPAPCHDVLAGFDWVRENLLRDEFKRPYFAPLGVCGELMGGSLATMLALTECRLGESRISAAAVNSPIVDWVFPDDLPFINPAELPEPVAPDETAFPSDEDLGDSQALREEVTVAKPSRPRKKRAPKPPPPTSWQAYGDDPVLPTLMLSGERDMLFRRPEDVFDRFASPIHFFRSPHAQLVLPDDDDTAASLPPLDPETQLELNHYASFDTSVKPAPVVPTLARCRSYARIYPPSGTHLSLPAWKISAGLQNPLSDQTAELAKLLRRNVARHTLKSYAGRSRWHDATEKERYEERAAERVQLESCAGLGLWAGMEEGAESRERVRGTGAWMKMRLEMGFSQARVG